MATATETRAEIDAAVRFAEESPLPEFTTLEAYERLDRAIRSYAEPGGPAGGPGRAFTPPYGSPYGSQRIGGNVFLPPAVNRGLPDVRHHLPTVAFLSRMRAAVAARDRAIVVRLRPAPHNRTSILSYSFKIAPEPHFLN